ncbi:MAG TPA: phosphoenolpyruvate--protein phosphotransferase [Caldithrix abyssi]|uniref:Phosphoenolpyruvate-protein phosphotransferase n=1 Tax=Caldithrix abyssi TaxID=187145 RepID=A0A7V5PRC4_CALAY|nr:phosphoenolpyruvate--protein phosphotransferase [Caldithrix abyssi]
MEKTVKKRKPEITLSGIPTSPGIALGPVFMFRSFSINISELEIKIEDVDQEIERFDQAVNQVIEQLNFAQNSSEAYYADQFAEIFESQKAFLNDAVLINEIKQEIKHSRHSAAYVVSKVLNKKSEHFINLENIYFRERAYDIIDLKYKLIHALLGIDLDYHLSKPSIVVAELLSPSDTVQFNRNLILGFLTDKGGKTSHAAIMARGLRIPAVVNRYNLSKIIHEDDYLILDGFKGTIIINPTEKTRGKYERIKKDYIRFAETLAEQIHLPAVTLDGEPVRLEANIEFAHELNDVRANKADGIGLLRTESIFIEKKALPSEEEQFNFYKRVVEQCNPNPVTIRTVDLGGDKLLEGYSQEDELNPFLGWRAIRFCLDKPKIFHTQLRAILRASAFGKVKILLPMVSAIEEVDKTKQILQQVQKELEAEKIDFDRNIQIGIMIETPAAAIAAPFFAKRIDFFSIGTNDLTQYVLAIDRTNEKVSKYYNTFNPAVLELVHRTIKAGEENNLEVVLCGEFAATPEAIPLLVGMGLRTFSMTPFYLPEAKKIIRSINSKDCEQLFQKTQQMVTAEEIEKTCHEFLEEHVPGLKFLI